MVLRRRSITNSISGRRRCLDIKRSIGEQKFQAAVETYEEFERIEKEEHAFLEQSGQKADTLQYFLKMEQAFASMQRRDEEGLSKAITIYEALKVKHPTDPALYYRWGTALADLKQPEKALPILEQGMKCLGAEQRGHWLSAAMPRNVSFAYWRLSELAPKSEEKLKLLEKAFQWAVEARTAAPAGHPQEGQALNSAIYFIVEYAAIAKQIGKPPLKSPTLEEDFKKFEMGIHIPTATDVRKLDTLCRAYEHLKGDHVRAVEVASRILSVMDNLEQSQFGPDENDIVAFARNVLTRDQRAAPARNSGTRGQRAASKASQPVTSAKKGKKGARRRKG